MKNKLPFLLLAILLTITLNYNAAKASAILVTIASQTNVTCNGTFNGTANTNVTGNVGTVTYLWTPGNFTSANLINVAAGTYTVTVTDAFDSTQSAASVTITEPLQLTVGMNHIDVTCNGGNDGTASASGVGGTSPYTYYWNPGSFTAPNINGLSAGSYTVNITDINGCAASTSVIINQNPAVTASVPSSVTICSGASYAMTPSFGGGNGTYTFNWSPPIGLSSTTLFNPSASPTTTTTYTFNVTDGLGCAAMNQITISVAPLPSVTVASNSPVCAGQTVSLTSSSPGAIAYSWTGPNGFTSSLQSPSVNNASTASSGIFSLTVTSSSSCTNSASTSVTVNPLPNVNAGLDQTVCQNSTINLVGTGSGSATYTWAGPNGFNSSISNPSLGALLPATGTYTLSVTDTVGCSDSDFVNITVISFPVLSGVVNFSGVSVNAGTVKAYNVTAGVFNLAGTTTVDGTGNFSFNLAPGDYIFSAELDTANYSGAVTTYDTASVNWNAAVPYNLTCGNTASTFINVIKVQPLVGSGVISGQIFGGNGPLKTYQQGDPVPGVDVSLEQNPGSVMLAQTSTDAAGAYSFTNVPVGNYAIYVDVPGLGMSATYDVNITAGSNTFTDAMFYVDSTGTIDTVRAIVLGNKPQTHLTNSVSVFPNPYSGYTNIGYELSEKANVNIEVFNILGEKVATLVNATKDAGKYNEKFSAKNYNAGAGIYFVRVSVNGNVKTLRLVETN